MSARRPSPYLTEREAAEFLRLRPRTLANMRWRGIGPKYRKHGGRIVYDIDDLIAWSRSNRPPTRPMRREHIALRYSRSLWHSRMLAVLVP